MNSKQYEQLERKIFCCEKCAGIIRDRIKYKFQSPRSGTLLHKKVKILFVGQNPGMSREKDPITSSESFHKVYDELIKTNVIGRFIELIFKTKNAWEYIGFTNVVKCPTLNNRQPLLTEVNNCNIYLKKQIEFVKPKVIITLGNFAYNVLLGTEHDSKIIKTFHPAAYFKYLKDNEKKYAIKKLRNEIKISLKETE